MKRVLVTGAEGFIGHHIWSYLCTIGASPGDHIIACQREIPDVSDVDYVVHCGAAAGPWCTPGEILADNMERMHTLVTRAQDWKVLGFVFLSSVSVYGDLPNASEVDELTLISNPTLYGISKLYGERLLHDYKIPSISLRLPGVVGSGVRGRNFLPRIARQIRDREPVSIANWTAPFNNVVHVSDLCRAVKRILASNRFSTGHQHFVLGSREPLMVGHVVEYLARRMSRELRVVRLAPTPYFTINSDRAFDAGIWHSLPIRTLLSEFAQEILDEHA